MEITEELIRKLKNYGALGIGFEQVVVLLELQDPQKALFIEQLSTPGNKIHDAYAYGIAAGDYNKEAKMEKLAETGDVDSINTQRIYRKQKKVEELKRKLFGI